jgi:diguanylate cyclase (GGDEF)-like protein
MSAVGAAAPGITGAIWDEVVAELPVGVLLQDERGKVVAANHLAAMLLGLNRDDLLGETRQAEWHAYDDSGAPLPAQAEMAAQVLRTSASLAVPVVLSRDGAPHVRVWADYHPVKHRGQPRLLVLLQPVQTDIARSRGLVDPLTGLPGRALLLDRLEQALTRARTHGTLATLVLVDVHQLSAVNAKHGFDLGDELLVIIAGRLRRGLRADHTVARYGGDEFAVIAEHPNGTGAPIAERIRHLTTRPVRITGVRLRPGLRLSWVTSDGIASILSVVTRAEERLRP